MLNLKSTMHPAFLSKSPTLLIPNLKSQYSTLHLSKLLISKSYTHFLYISNSNSNNISLGNFHISSFISTPVIIRREEYPGTEYGRIETSETSFLHVHDGYFLKARSKFEVNAGPCCGGAISVMDKATIICENVYFISCSSYIQGGAIKVYFSDNLTISNCTFRNCYTSFDNTISSSYGAAVFASNLEYLYILDTFFYDNLVSSESDSFRGVVVIENCHYTTLYKLEFDNDANVKSDIIFDFNDQVENPYEYDNKIVKIERCCFKKEFPIGSAIEIDNANVSQPNMLSSFVCIDSSFVQDIYHYYPYDDEQRKLPTNLFTTAPNHINAPYCIYSNFFSQSHQFSTSSQFSSSLQFTTSFPFTKSFMFSGSQAFTISSGFTPSELHPETEPFTKSDLFSFSDQFTYSGDFTKSEPFSPSYIKSTLCFSLSTVFSLSNEFTNSDNFTDINYAEKGVKLSSGGIAGIVIACLVVLAIIILLIILFLRRKRSAFIPPEDDPMNIDGLDIPINMYD